MVDQLLDVQLLVGSRHCKYHFVAIFVHRDIASVYFNIFPPYSAKFVLYVYTGPHASASTHPPRTRVRLSRCICEVLAWERELEKTKSYPQTLLASDIPSAFLTFKTGTNILATLYLKNSDDPAVRKFAGPTFFCGDNRSKSEKVYLLLIGACSSRGEQAFSLPTNFFEVQLVTDVLGCAGRAPASRAAQ